MTSSNRRARVGTFGILLRLVTALLVALLSVPVAGLSAQADDSTGTTSVQTEAPADPAATEPATEPAATEEPAAPAAPESEPASAPTAQESDTSSSTRTTSTQSLVEPSGVPGACDTNDGLGKVDLFEQNTREDETGDWINGNINAIKGPLYEGQFVPQRLTMIQMAAGENEIVIESKLLEGGLHAYDFIPEPGNTDYPGFVPQTTNATITNWDVTIGPVVNGDQWSTIEVTFDVAAAGTVVIKWYPHIASELDYGPATGAGSINGSPYHNKLVSLNCDSTGSRDNPIMAGAIHYATITWSRTPSPTAQQDFHFTSFRVATPRRSTWTTTATTPTRCRTRSQPPASRLSRRLTTRSPRPTSQPAGP